MSVRFDAENRKKTSDNFYTMDEESMITIREEFSVDFYVLAEVQIDAVRKLLEQFEDDQLQATLELEAYEWKRGWNEVEQRAE